MYEFISTLKWSCLHDLLGKSLFIKKVIQVVVDLSSDHSGPGNKHSFWWPANENWMNERRHDTSTYEYMSQWTYSLHSNYTSARMMSGDGQYPLNGTGIRALNSRSDSDAGALGICVYPLARGMAIARSRGGQCHRGKERVKVAQSNSGKIMEKGEFSGKFPGKWEKTARKEWGVIFK